MTSKFTTSLLAGAIALALPLMAAAQTGARTTPDATPDSPSAVAPYAPLATITESFDALGGTSPNQCPTGWICSNVSSPLGVTNWFQQSASPPFPAQAGTGYIAANFNNTSGAGTISNWLITPVMQFGTGAELRFWARTTTSATYPDRVEIRASTGGSSNGGTSSSTGDFSILLGTINPGLAAGGGTCGVPAGAPGAGGFPNAWCEYRLTNADGIPTSGSGRIAFRYYITDGGPSGSNSDYMGIDTFSFVEGSSPITSVPASGNTIAFPSYTVGTAALTSTITFSNPNGSDGTVTCTAPTPTSFTASPLVITVPANGTATTTVSFSSTSGGSFNGTLNCLGGNGEEFSFPLTAVAAAPGVPVPAFGDGARWMLLLGVLGLGAFALRQRWS
jgi:hypothetical protein